MSQTVWVLIGAESVRLAVLLVVVWRCLRLLVVLDRRRDRRRANPSLRYGVFLLSCAATGLLALSFRAAAVPLGGASWWWLFLYSEPDVVGRLANALCSSLAGLGLILFLRGAAAVLLRDSPGDLPRVFRWRREAA